jgi:hypothetical protein
MNTKSRNRRRCFGWPVSSLGSIGAAGYSLSHRWEHKVHLQRSIDPSIRWRYPAKWIHGATKQR